MEKTVLLLCYVAEMWVNASPFRVMYAKTKLVCLKKGDFFLFSLSLSALYHLYLFELKVLQSTEQFLLCISIVKVS